MINEITQDDAWIIGGGKVYQETLPRVQQAVVTVIDTQLGWMENAVHAPELEEFTLVEASDWILSKNGHLTVGNHQDDALRYRFCTYERNQ